MAKSKRRMSRGAGTLGALGRGFGGGGLGKAESEKAEANLDRLFSPQLEEKSAEADKISLTVKLASLKVKGDLSSSIIRRVIVKRMNSIKHAYQKELRSKPALQGEIRLQFVIAANGKVESVKLNASSLNDRILEKAIMKIVSKMRFPESKDGKSATVHCSFTFKAGH